MSRNVAALVTPPKGLEGRPSKSLSLAQAQALFKAAEASLLYAYIVLSLLTGCRTEEARALTWDHVDLDGDPDADPPVPPHVAVWRSVRSHGDVKTRKSRRTLRLPMAAVEALRVHKVKQAEDRLLAGALWQDHGLVFPSAVGTPLDPSHVRRAFRKVCKAAGLALTGARGVAAHICLDHERAGCPSRGDSKTGRAQHHRHDRGCLQARAAPVISTGAEVMDTIFVCGDASWLASAVCQDRRSTLVSSSLS